MGSILRICGKYSEVGQLIHRFTTFSSKITIYFLVPGEKKDSKYVGSILRICGKYSEISEKYVGSILRSAKNMWEVF